MFETLNHFRFGRDVARFLNHTKPAANAAPTIDTTLTMKTSCSFFSRFAGTRNTIRIMLMRVIANQRAFLPEGARVASGPALCRPSETVGAPRGAVKGGRSGSLPLT